MHGMYGVRVGVMLDVCMYVSIAWKGSWENRIFEAAGALLWLWWEENLIVWLYFLLYIYLHEGFNV
jgi:hypothetical protein